MSRLIVSFTRHERFFYDSQLRPI